jgi:hypothetical protein
LLLAPCIIPVTLLGYACARWTVGWVGNTWFYGALLTARLVPVATLVLYFVPPGMSRAARYCGVLAGKDTCGFRLRALGNGPWLAGGLVWLLAFSEFELAALLGVRSWTVTLFDAHVGGLALTESLRLVAVPAALELAVLAVVAWLGRQSRLALPETAAPTRAGWAYLTVVAVVVAVVPAGLVIGQSLPGWRVLVENFAVGRDLAASVGFGVVAAGLAYAASRRWAVALPGLLGPLVIGLVLVAVFQWRGLRALYDTPVPLVVGLTLTLAPAAVALRWMLDAMRPQPAVHAARLAGRRDVVWQLDTRRRWWMLFLLFVWGYGEFTAATLLAPVGVTPVFARLHNLMHYGQTAVLSALVLAALATPVAVGAAGWAVARWRWR